VAWASHPNRAIARLPFVDETALARPGHPDPRVAGARRAGRRRPRRDHHRPLVPGR
jgi:hypothetical protein